MKSVATKIPIVFSHAGFSTDDEHDRVHPIRKNFWNEEVKYLASFSYEHAGCAVNVKLDWTAFVERLRNSWAIFEPLYSGGTFDQAAYSRLPRETECSATVEITGENDFTKHWWYPRHFAELALYDAFICANLAFPGALDLYSARIPPSSSELGRPTELKLSSYNFEYWWVESLRGHFPKLKQLPLKAVREWYSLSGLAGRSKAQDGVDRAVFCLFHLCRSDNYIDGLIWVFHALEALLDTRVGENLSGMYRRITLLIDLSERDKKALKKKLKRAYDLRSAFVHGGYDIPHPAHNEVTDPAIGNNYAEGLDLQQFGMALVLSLLQHVVQARTATYHFREVFVPHIRSS
jgi:hypothetical protein